MYAALFNVLVDHLDALFSGTGLHAKARQKKESENAGTEEFFHVGIIYVQHETNLVSCQLARNAADYHRNNIDILPYIKCVSMQASATLSTPAQITITRAALHKGLTQVGRLAVEYQTLFNENPCKTLSRLPP
jgi:hypothetical protein